MPFRHGSAGGREAAQRHVRVPAGPLAEEAGVAFALFGELADLAANALAGALWLAYGRASALADLQADATRPSLDSTNSPQGVEIAW